MAPGATVLVEQPPTPAPAVADGSVMVKSVGSAPAATSAGKVRESRVVLVTVTAWGTAVGVTMLVAPRSNLLPGCTSMPIILPVMTNDEVVPLPRGLVTVTLFLTVPPVTVDEVAASPRAPAECRRLEEGVNGEEGIGRIVRNGDHRPFRPGEIRGTAPGAGMSSVIRQVWARVRQAVVESKVVVPQGCGVSRCRPLPIRRRGA